MAVRGLRALKRKQRLYPKLGKRNNIDKIRNCCFKNHRNSRINKQVLELFLQKKGQAIRGWRGPCKGTASLIKGKRKTHRKQIY